MPFKNATDRKKYQSNYRKSASYKARHAEYKKTHPTVYDPVYGHSDKHVSAVKDYQKTEKGKEVTKAASLKYRTTEKDKLAVYEMNLKRNRGITVVEYVEREKLRAMYDNRCAYCGKELDADFHIDHMLPVSRYRKIGKKCPHSYANCVPACKEDNLKKHDRTPLEFLWETGV